MMDEKSVSILNFYELKHDVIELMIKKATENKIEKEEIEKFINYINIIIKSNKSKNSIDSRLSGLYKLVKEYYYNNYKKVNEVITQQ